MDRQAKVLLSLRRSGEALPSERYLLRFENTSGLTPAQRERVKDAARRAVPSPGVRVGTLRVGKEAVELDLFVGSIGELERAVPPLEAALGRLLHRIRADAPSAPQPIEAVVEEAKDLFNGERFWECHEVLEGVWQARGGKTSREPETLLLQGLILVAAAYVQQQKGAEERGLALLRKASRRLEAWQEALYHGLDVRDLRRQIGDVLEAGALSSIQLG